MRSITVLLMGLWVVAACEDQGPLERAGEEIDEAFEGDTLGNRLDDAADDLQDGIEDAADELDR